MHDSESRRVVVTKVGGSVLVGQQSYQRTANFLARRLSKCREERFVVVVSAQNGHTDELERLAGGVVGRPNPATLDLLWSTGETQSVALLALHLEAFGVAAAGLNIHETGLRVDGRRKAQPFLRVLAQPIKAALQENSIVVVPGFFGITERGAIVSLGRGGSDLSAVLLADGLGSACCELIKDVPGYFTADPSIERGAQHLPWVSYERALAMSENGCELVQREALEAARDRRLRLIVRSLDDGAPSSMICDSEG